jgi:hypothetical protein
MNRFSIGQAWSNATGFFSGNAANFAILIIGIGVLVPLVLQWAITGNPMENAFNPALMGARGGGAAAMAGMGAAAVLVALASYVIQFGSYFSSWRLGFGPDGGDLAGASRFGFGAGAIYVGLLIATGVLTAVIAVAITPWLAIPLFFVIFGFFVIMFPALFGFLAILFFLAAIFGAAAGGGMLPVGGAVGLLIILLFAVGSLWLAARLCCTGPAMADAGEFLPFAALRRSWTLTAEGQWRIVGYFLLIGAILFVLLLVLGLVVGASIQSAFMTGSTPGMGVVMLGTFFVSIPIAYFTVAVPAGIYRVVSVSNAGDVFA